MTSGSRFLLILLSGLAALTPAQGRLGDTLAQITAHRGAPASQPKKEGAVWLFETEDGQLAYTVTFNAQGKSIAEGLKPVKRARLLRAVAEDFMQAQLEPFPNSKTRRNVKPKETYTFGGQQFTCAEDEVVIVDDPNSVLLVWTTGRVPSVMAVSHEMVR